MRTVVLNIVDVKKQKKGGEYGVCGNIINIINSYIKKGFKMICYRDKTFCTFNKCKKFNKCYRSYNDKTKKNHEVFNKKNRFDIPLCTFLEKPICYK